MSYLTLSLVWYVGIHLKMSQMFCWLFPPPERAKQVFQAQNVKSWF